MKTLITVLLLSALALGQNFTNNPGNLTAAASTCGVTNCVPVTLPANAAVVGVTLSGTFSATAQFEGSADGTNFVSVNAYPVPSGASVTSATAAGTWLVPVAGMQVFRVRVSSYSSGQVTASVSTSTQPFNAPPSSGNSIGAVSITNTAGSTDPCQNPSVVKSSAKISLTSTTASQLVALSSGKIIYVCGFLADIQGSATTVGTLQLEYGTQTTNPCDTGTTTLTPALPGNITANVPTVINMPGGYTQFSTTASQQLCAVATGTTISVQGYVTYVQQ